MSPTSPRRAGFTLMELIVVIAVMGVATTIGMTMFHRVFSMWNRVSARTELDAKAEIAFEEMRQDFSEIASSSSGQGGVKGAEAAVQDSRFFRVQLADDAITMTTQRVKGPGEAPERFNVAYFIDRDGPVPCLMRTTGPLGDPKPSGNKIRVAEGVVGMRIEYMPRTEGADWVTVWQGAELPCAARVSLTLMDPDLPDEQASRKKVFWVNVK